jgi:hypothetical protein
MRASTLLLALAALPGAARAALCYPTCVAGGHGSADTCTFTATLDVFASSTGYYKFEECGDEVNPTLAVKRGAITKFVQNDASNWMHPLGFAYEPDGAHKGVNELEPGLAGAPGVTHACTADNKCDAPMYYFPDGVGGSTYVGAAGGDTYRSGCYSTSTHTVTCTSMDVINAGGCPGGDTHLVWTECGGEDFGLDYYEPNNFVRRQDWRAFGTEPADEDSGAAEGTLYGLGDMHVDVQITQDTTTEFFYFCHIHNWMSGRIKVIESGDWDSKPAAGSADVIALGYEYESLSDFDASCGTHGIGEYAEGGALHHLCGDTAFVCPASSGQTESSVLFEKCLNAMDCAMHHEMKVAIHPTAPSVTFMHQMIPHHENAVRMSKALLKIDPDEGGRRHLRAVYDATHAVGSLKSARRLDDEASYGAIDLEDLAYEIIAVQNYQIMNMRNTFAETMPDTIGEKHNGGATSDSYVIDTGYECEEGVETACPSGQYRLTDDGNCEAIPEDTACPAGQYRITDAGKCEPVPEHTACSNKKSGGGFGRADVILLFIGLGIGGCFTAIAFCCGKCMAPKKQLA